MLYPYPTFRITFVTHHASHTLMSRSIPSKYILDSKFSYHVNFERKLFSLYNSVEDESYFDVNSATTIANMKPLSKNFWINYTNMFFY